ncbi:retinoic acid-induced protein 1-like isoform X1 [Sinocyclocheilus rhinocerous]|uniref:Retinoic acid-induced protein 1-like n=1 Tax=Sinocyclocheilus rhinocerous TaxID=307959 RepID=A0A673FTD9_9TELE|nr:PREDICTED: retinoic acid-induced protein 1-like isoform X1 [Sinocyclocheilus rhinocerous]
MICSVALGSKETLYSSVMEPLNQVDVMHLQESRSSALDLSVGCRQSPLKTNSIEGLDLLKKPSWCGITSGSKSVNTSESRCITWPSKPNSPDHPEPGSKRHGTSSHSPYSIPLPLINGLPSVAQILSQCPTTDQVFTDDSDYRMEMGHVLTQTKNSLKKADSVLGGRIAHKEMHPQDIVTSCGETYLSDTSMSQTKGSSCLPQDAYTLRSTSSAVEQTAIETLASECTGAKKTSPCSVEYISSADDSDVIEVPVSNSRCKMPPSCRSRTRSVIVNERSRGRRGNSSVKHKVAMDCSPKHVNNVYALDEPDFEGSDGRADSESKSLLSWMESVCIAISPEDSDQDMDAAFPENFPSTSDAENTSVFKSPQSGASSSMSSRLWKTPASKSRKRAKPRPKPAKPVRAPPAGKLAKRRRRKPRSSGPSSMFSFQEPEIKLKYADHKEEKKDSRPDSFAPYVHMEFSSCTIVNFREEDVYSTKKGSQQVVSGVIPKTSCLQLGRVASDARLEVRRFCCLCGRAGNIEGLGDLHGPYYSSGAQAVCKSDSSPLAQKQEPDCSDLDSVYSLEDGASQSVRRQRKENCSESVEESGVCSEHWIHEDCSIWTAGIFLVKGKLYGLEEAIRLAQGTVCSYCHMVGATLGCFFKDCPNKYHFPCALQSGRRRQMWLWSGSLMCLQIVPFDLALHMLSVCTYSQAVECSGLDVLCLLPVARAVPLGNAG